MARRSQPEFVDSIQKDLGDPQRLANLALARDTGGNLAEPGEQHSIGTHGSRMAAAVVGRQVVRVESQLASSERSEESGDIALEVVKAGRAHRFAPIELAHRTARP